jgi:hypothetical protein
LVVSQEFPIEDWPTWMQELAKSLGQQKSRAEGPAFSIKVGFNQ